VSENIEPESLVTEHQQMLLERLASEIKCSPKAISFYLNKKIKKLKNEKERKTQNTEQSKNNNYSVKKIINDLQELDKIVAPNVCPFEVHQKSSKSKSRFAQENIQECF
jgi:uncharacterized FlaG/YvyC family protein